MEHEELARLLPLARAGDEKALNTLLVHLRERARGVAERQLGARARVDGSDVAQEVVLRVWEALNGLDGQTVPTLLAWVDRIARNFLTDQGRRAGAQRRDAALEVPGGELFPDLAGDASTPSQAAIRNEERARAQQALARLPERLQQVVRLRFQEGLAFAEAARRLDVTEKYARVLMVRALERLRQELGEQP